MVNGKNRSGFRVPSSEFRVTSFDFSVSSSEFAALPPHSAERLCLSVARLIRFEAKPQTLGGEASQNQKGVSRKGRALSALFGGRAANSKLET
jgi:hypothetical protein